MQGLGVDGVVLVGEGRQRGLAFEGKRGEAELLLLLLLLLLVSEGSEGVVGGGRVGSGGGGRGVSLHERFIGKNILDLGDRWRSTA